MKEIVRIGLTHTGSDQKHENYVKWLTGEESKLIEVVTLMQGRSSIDDLDRCDGLVLSGGIDIHPSVYGMQEGYPHQPGKFNIERDRFETALFERAQYQQLPVLGVCRGLQLINCLLGGTLHQDMGEAKNKVHKIEQLSDKVHEVNVGKGSQLEDIVKTNRLTVNSAHHQSVDVLATDLRVCCTSEDDTIEALEWKSSAGKPFLLCIQWHPERMFQLQLQESGAAKGIRDRLVQELIKKDEL